MKTSEWSWSKQTLACVLAGLIVGAVAVGGLMVDQAFGFGMGAAWSVSWGFLVIGAFRDPS